MADKKIPVKTRRAAAPRAAVKKAAPEKTAPEKAAPEKALLAVSIDYPKEGEAVRSGHYSIRLTAVGASSAQCRVNGGDWLDFREAIGHFWHDWAPRAGEARLEARARCGKERWTVSPARTVTVSD